MSGHIPVVAACVFPVQADRQFYYNIGDWSRLGVDTREVGHFTSITPGTASGSRGDVAILGTVPDVYARRRLDVYAVAAARLADTVANGARRGGNEISSAIARVLEGVRRTPECVKYTVKTICKTILGAFPLVEKAGVVGDGDSECVREHCFGEEQEL